MTYTQNYQLPQWVKSDRILMDDFNDANSKIDAALHGLRQDVDTHNTANTAAHAVFGNCKVVAGSYVGTGTYGSENKNSLTFSEKPMMVVLFQKTRSASSNNRMIMIRGAAWSYSYDEYSNSYNGITWGENSVSWSCNSAAYQYNEEGENYCYIALLAADA